MTLTWWDVLTGLVVPGLGVLASTAIAVAALLVSRSAMRLAAATHQEDSIRGATEGRQAFATQVIEYLDAQREQVARRGKVAARPLAS